MDVYFPIQKRAMLSHLHSQANPTDSQNSVQLFKSNVSRVLPETAAADVEPIFPDQAMVVGADPAGKTNEKWQRKWQISVKHDSNTVVTLSTQPRVTFYATIAGINCQHFM